MNNAFRKIPGLIRFARLCRVAILPRRRSEWLLQRQRPENLFQPVSLTTFNRYPKIFSFVRDRLIGNPAPRILSFGCSTGEEVFTLRQYFPDAEIVGIDINFRNISVCCKKLKRSGDSRIRFAVSGSADAEPEGYFDAVFCMGVFRHGNLGVSRPEKCDSLIRFADFEKTVSGLARALKHGGYLAIRGSNFRFSDTAAAEFDVALNLAKGPRADTPIYGPDNRIRPDTSGDDGVFCKRTQEHVSFRQPEEASCAGTSS